MHPPISPRLRILLSVGLSLALGGALLWPRPQARGSRPSQPTPGTPASLAASALVQPVREALPFLLPLDEGRPLRHCPPDRRPFPWLPPHLEAPAGLSIGTTRDGSLVDGVPLPLDNPLLRILPSAAGRELHFATPALIEILETAALEVSAQFPGSVLSLGNLSAQDGGDIPFSVSHNAGRDVDLAFFYTDAAGNPVEVTGLIDLNRQGWSMDGRLQFDAPRTWSLVRSLLAQPRARIQWLFISSALRSALLEHARAQEEPAWILERAEVLLGQPGDSAPHHDHLHLRLLCSPEDLRGGCRDTGRLPPWETPHQHVLEDRAHQARAWLQATDPQVRARAAALLGLLGLPWTAPDLERSLHDPAGLVRASAILALELLEEGRPPLREELRALEPSPAPGESAAFPPDEAGASLPSPAASAPAPGASTNPPDGAAVLPDWRGWVLEALAEDIAPEVVEVGLAVLLRAREARLVPLLERWLREPQTYPAAHRDSAALRCTQPTLPRTPWPGFPPLPAQGWPLERPLERQALAAMALGQLEHAPAVPWLIALLREHLHRSPQEGGETAAAALAALELLANRRFSPGTAGLGEVEAFWEAFGDRPRAAWLLTGFRAAGLRITDFNRRASPALVQALDAPWPLAYNAHRQLEILTGAALGGRIERFSDVQVGWGRWLKRNPVPAAKQGRQRGKQREKRRGRN